MNNVESKQTQLILVGGFLGAGKTTLLHQAALHLVRQGRRVGLITNDQAADLVDTAILRQAGFGVEEITGGCFCCRFGDLIDSSNRLVATAHVDVLIGEPAGSCTDISATVLQPIKDLFARQYRLAPFTVLVDPMRLEEVLNPRVQSPFHPSARYILRKQLEEADLIAINKIDLLGAADLADLQARAKELFPDTPQVALSALTAGGLEDWFKRLARNGAAGRRIPEVDYDIYAEGEAVLGWLNAIVHLHSTQPIDWTELLSALLRALRTALVARKGKVVHLKALITAGEGRLIANLTPETRQVLVSGSLSGNPQEVRLVINARAEIAPVDLGEALQEGLKHGIGNVVTWQVAESSCLSPSRPEPTHRYNRVVANPGTYSSRDMSKIRGCWMPPR